MLTFNIVAGNGKVYSGRRLLVPNNEDIKLTFSFTIAWEEFSERTLVLIYPDVHERYELVDSEFVITKDMIKDGSLNIALNGETDEHFITSGKIILEIDPEMKMEDE